MEEGTGTSWDQVPARETALVLAIDHWRGDCTASPRAVVETASKFLAFLEPPVTRPASQFAGSGLTVNITGLKMEDSARVAADMASMVRRLNEPPFTDDDGPDFVGAPV